MPAELNGRRIIVTDLVLYHDTHLELTDTPVWDQAVRITRNLDVMGRNVQW